MLSIPRDTKVTINGTTNRINAFFNEGPAQIVDAVSQFAQVPIHHYLQVDFAGFAGIVDAVGGIEMTFPYPARDRKSKLDVAAGTQVLDGRTALAWPAPATTRSSATASGCTWTPATSAAPAASRRC